jgi:LSD1 subclass zinc finger protein
MTAPELLAELARRGVTARVVGDRLRLAPAEALDEALLAEARRLKPDVMRLLAPELAVPTTCVVCGGAREPVLFTVAGRPAVRCGECGTWDLVGGAA